MTRRLLLAFSLLVTACLFFASCSLGGKRGNKKKLPASIGQPYEVLLEGDTLDIVKTMLTEDVDILPQPEPMCNVISVKRGKVSGSYLLMRTRVVLYIGTERASTDKEKENSDERKTFSNFNLLLFFLYKQIPIRILCRISIKKRTYRILRF